MATIETSSNLYDELTLLTVITKVAIVITIGSFLTGLFICKTIWTKQSTVGIPAHMFMAGILCTFLWLTYGIHLKDSTQILVNFVGVSTQSFYLIFYYLMCHNKRVIRRQFLFLVLLILSIQSFLWTRNEDQFIFYSGLFASTSAMFFTASPLVQIKTVIKSKSTECLPFPFILCSFVVGSLWLTYGYLVNDMFIMTPNAIGSTISMFQLILFMIYPSKSEKVADKMFKHSPDHQSPLHVSSLIKIQSNGQSSSTQSLLTTLNDV